MKHALLLLALVLLPFSAFAEKTAIWTTGPIPDYPDWTPHENGEYPEGVVPMDCLVELYGDPTDCNITLNFEYQGSLYHYGQQYLDQDNYFCHLGWFASINDMQPQNPLPAPFETLQDLYLYASEYNNNSSLWPPPGFGGDPVEDDTAWGEWRKGFEAGHLMAASIFAACLIFATVIRAYKAGGSNESD